MDVKEKRRRKKKKKRGEKSSSAHPKRTDQRGRSLAAVAAVVFLKVLVRGSDAGSPCLPW